MDSILIFLIAKFTLRWEALFQFLPPQWTTGNDHFKLAFASGFFPKPAFYWQMNV